MVYPYDTRIQQLGVDISPPEGDVPEGQAAELVPVGLTLNDVDRGWGRQTYYWQAAATRHQPLYFEEVNAERHGYTCGKCWQPFVSTAHFFATIPALP